MLSDIVKVIFGQLVQQYSELPHSMIKLVGFAHLFTLCLHLSFLLVREIKQCHVLWSVLVGLSQRHHKFYSVNPVGRLLIALRHRIWHQLFLLTIIFDEWVLVAIDGIGTQLREVRGLLLM